MVILFYLIGIPRFVAGSVGPYGAAMHDGSEYNGNYTDTLTKQVNIIYDNSKCFCLKKVSNYFILY